MAATIEVNRILVDLSRYNGPNTTPSGYPDLFAIEKALTEHPDKPIEGVTIYKGKKPLPLRSNEGPTRR